MDYETINTIRAHVRKILREMKMNGDPNQHKEELIAAVWTLINDIESMICLPDNDYGGRDCSCWYGEFSEYEENSDGQMVVEWPNLAIGVERIKKILDKLASQ
jgi:hypothetical protein